MGFEVEKMGMHKPTIAWLQTVAGWFWRFSRVPTAFRVGRATAVHSKARFSTSKSGKNKLLHRLN